MHRKRPDTGNLSRLQRAQHGILQQTGTESFPLPCRRNRQTGQEHDRRRVLRKALLQPFRGSAVLHLAHDERVVAGDFLTGESGIGLRTAGLLALKSARTLSSTNSLTDRRATAAAI